MRDPITTVKDHLDAVHTGDPEAMAADYAADAVLVRDVTYQGDAVLGARCDLPGQRRHCRLLHHRAGMVMTTRRWPGGVRPASNGRRIGGRGMGAAVGGPGNGTTGTDRFEVAEGMIVRQTVTLDMR